MLPPSTPDGFPRAGVTVDGQFLPGFLCYGIPVGSPVYVCHQLSLKVQEVAREVSLIVKVMKGEGQAIWTIARSSTAMKLDYHLTLCYPSDMNTAGREMDTCLWNMLGQAAGFAIPRVDGGRGLECCLAPPVRTLQRKSYQDWITRTPVRLGGMGFRSVEETSLLAYIGGVEQDLSNCIGEGGVCQQLMSTGNRTGEELALAWDTLRQEAVESYRFLGKEVDGLLEREVQGAGDGQSDGSTRRALTKWVEDTRNSLLVKALELLPD